MVVILYCLQDQYGNAPYQNWELRAEGLNSTLLTIEGGVTNIVVKIEVEICNVCMCVYVCVCMYVCMYIYMCMYACMCVCVIVYICVCM